MAAQSSLTGMRSRESGAMSRKYGMAANQVVSAAWIARTGFSVMSCNHFLKKFEKEEWWQSIALISGRLPEREQTPQIGRVKPLWQKFVRLWGLTTLNYLTPSENSVFFVVRD